MPDDAHREAEMLGRLVVHHAGEQLELSVDANRGHYRLEGIIDGGCLPEHGNEDEEVHPQQYWSGLQSTGNLARSAALDGSSDVGVRDPEQHEHSLREVGEA